MEYILRSVHGKIAKVTKKKKVSLSYFTSICLKVYKMCSSEMDGLCFSDFVKAIIKVTKVLRYKLDFSETMNINTKSERQCRAFLPG